MQSASNRIHVVDSHTGGEPTRVVIAGGPDLGSGDLSRRLARFRESFDCFRSAIVNEPRGSEAMVGALLCEPVDSTCSAGVIFFNNVGYLGMCGHGIIGLTATLKYLGRIQTGSHRIETPVGVVTVELHSTGEVSFENVASCRLRKGVSVFLSEAGEVIGDVAWGGNWFFLTHQTPCSLELRNLEQLTAFCWQIRQALGEQRITGTNGREIDHIELSAGPSGHDVDSVNFVLCPGKAYDRSPCGTGTSAKLACLFADGLIREGQIWRQAGILGSVFEGSVTVRANNIYPRIKGTAFVNSEAHLFLQEQDPFCWGIRV